MVMAAAQDAVEDAESDTERASPDSTQVGHDRRHRLHLVCAQFVLLLFSVLLKGSRESLLKVNSENTVKRFGNFPGLF